MNDMPRWKQDETEFVVSVNDDGNGGNICRIPKPIVEMLGIAGSVKFINKKGKVSVEADNT